MSPEAQLPGHLPTQKLSSLYAHSINSPTLLPLLTPSPFYCTLWNSCAAPPPHQPSPKSFGVITFFSECYRTKIAISGENIASADTLLSGGNFISHKLLS